MAENNPAEIPRTTLPRYAREAAELALQLATLSTEELERMLRTNRQIAATNRRRYRQFHGEEALPALLAYTGVVFRHIAPERFTPGDFEYAQQHLNITSFLYGLLRPLDAIRRYRLEGDAVLPGHDDQTMFGYWQGRLTEAFLEKIHADDGILVNLASSEMKRLFDWKRIRREARIITPEFRIREGDRLKTIVVYTKMCRGEMTRHLIRNGLRIRKGSKNSNGKGSGSTPRSAGATIGRSRCNTAAGNGGAPLRRSVIAPGRRTEACPSGNRVVRPAAGCG